MADVAEVAESENTGQPEEESRAQPTLREYAESLLVTIVLALFATTFVVQAFKIPSQSMEPTLLVGDHLLVNKFLFGGRGHWYDHLLPYRLVRHSDIIVFKFPFDDHPHYVKRVIGLPGDHIKIISQRVFINGQLQSEPYVVHDAASEDPFADNFPPTDRYFLNGSVRPEWSRQILDNVQNGDLVVPPDHYFVMGDNRDHSWDSRYWGFVDRDAIMGRPVVIYWSVQGARDDEADRNLNSWLVSFLDTILHLPSRTRWSRMLHEVH